MKPNIADESVTVLMPVFDGAAYLREAIDSILSQTFTDFELLVIDDGSKDETPEILASVDDRRLRVLRNEHNEGLVRALNRGLDRARGRFIARMDADDVSLPMRLAKQIEYLETNAEVGAVGSWVAEMDTGHSRVWEYPTQPDEVRAKLLFGCPVAHPSIVLRSEFFETHGLRYDEAYPHAEDYELWMRASEHFPIANLAEPLVRYRLHHESVSHRNDPLQQKSTEKIQSEALVRLGAAPSRAELRIHRWLTAPKETSTELDFILRDVDSWLKKLLRANDKASTYPQHALQRLIGHYWFEATIRMRASNPAAISQFFSSTLSRHVDRRRRLRLGLGAIKRAILPH